MSSATAGYDVGRENIDEAAEDTKRGAEGSLSRYRFGEAAEAVGGRRWDKVLTARELRGLREAGGRRRERSCPPRSLGNRGKEVAAKQEELEYEAQKKRSLYLMDIESRKRASEPLRHITTKIGTPYDTSSTADQELGEPSNPYLAFHLAAMTLPWWFFPQWVGIAAAICAVGLHGRRSPPHQALDLPCKNPPIDASIPTDLSRRAYEHT
ncbi:hypothetical protein BU16DRAFT_538045 [Lophium mytilinum]|uniref:Uncharacterized protein n=1 Tax=Lophium mytilinum TaxID=390894 RepID=A0A6A6R0H7_9PEZI|nr:hypothetical protein BU16DRAFT_538045 [Lophium mytilinum]